MKKENWIWMPHPGHYICSARCNFRLNTYVGGYIVSTVGELILDINNIKFEDIGSGRKYETMVFKAEKSEGQECCPYDAIVSEEVECRGYNSAEAAYLGHLRLCEEWSEKS